MKIAVISTYTHPTRLVRKERGVMQSSVPELIASLCPDHAEVEVYNEKETNIPLDRDWDLVFFSYLHSYYEHTKVLSTLLRQRGIKTVAGGRHALHFADDCEQYFDSVVTGEPESNVPALIEDFERGQLQKRYGLASSGPAAIRPYRYDLIDFRTNRIRLPGIEASRGCPFTCNFCVLTGHEKYRYRPVQHVIDEIQFKMSWNKNYFGLLDNAFSFLDNNLGGNPRYLRELCEALLPLKKTWGCALTFNVLKDEETVRLMARAGCRYVYTGLESLNPDSIKAMNKGQNKISEVDRVIRRCFDNGIMLSFGLLVGSDGDRRIPRTPAQYLSDLSTSHHLHGDRVPVPGDAFLPSTRARGADTARHGEPRLRRLHALPPPPRDGAHGGRRALPETVPPIGELDERSTSLSFQALDEPDAQLQESDSRLRPRNPEREKPHRQRGAEVHRGPRPHRAVGSTENGRAANSPSVPEPSRRDYAQAHNQGLRGGDDAIGRACQRLTNESFLTGACLSCSSKSSVSRLS